MTVEIALDLADHFPDLPASAGIGRLLDRLHEPPRPYSRGADFGLCGRALIAG